MAAASGVITSILLFVIYKRRKKKKQASMCEKYKIIALRLTKKGYVKGYYFWSASFIFYFLVMAARA